MSDSTNTDRWKKITDVIDAEIIPIIAGLFVVAVLAIALFKSPVFTLFVVEQGWKSCNGVVKSDPVPEGLVAYYLFNNEHKYGETKRIVCDYSGHNHTAGISHARFNRSTSPLEDGSYDFDGEKSKIIVPDSDDLSANTTGQLTISLWARFDSTSFVGEGSGKNYVHFLGKGGNGKDYEYMFRQYNSSNSQGKNNMISFYLFNSEGGLGTGSYVQDPIKPGEWIHLVGVANGTHVQIWKNGVLRDVDPYTNYNVTPSNGAAPLSIGTSDGDSYFKGAIDEVRVYNRTLSASEIMEIYRVKKHKIDTLD